MIKFNSRSAFQSSIVLPFNVYTCFDIEHADGSIILPKSSQIEDFWATCIEPLKNEINDETETNRIRFMLIHSDGYCGTATFLGEILKEHDEDGMRILYYSYPKHANLADELMDQKMNNGTYFLVDESVFKICVIDCAEQIEDYAKQLSSLCTNYCREKIIFIFLARFSSNIPNHPIHQAESWGKFLEQLEIPSNQGRSGIIRSRRQYYRLKDYTCEACASILESLHNPSLNQVIDIYKTGYEGGKLCKPFFLDLLIYKFNENSVLFSNIHTANDLLNFIEGIAECQYGLLEAYFNNSNAASLGVFIDIYFQDKDSSALSVERITNAWTKGILHFYRSDSNYYDEVLDTLFQKLKINKDGSSIDNFENHIDTNLLIAINIQLFKEVNGQLSCNFSVRQYLSQMIKKDRDWAAICALLLLNQKIQASLDIELFKFCFVALGKKYATMLMQENEIFAHIQLGKRLGLLLKMVDNRTIETGLKHLFNGVSDDYILPKTNDNGISVIPVTNFEFAKFVLDGGYSRLDANEGKLHDIAVSYYGHMLEFVIGLFDEFSDDSNKKCLSTLLKGYDEFYYNQIAYIYKHRNAIKNKMEEILSVNYPGDMRYPTKWGTEQYQQETLFCNPLQPVVGVNIFEARAYAAWLSEKTGKSIRVLSYEPDFVSVIGTEEKGSEDAQRKSFNQFLQQQERYINSSEQSAYFYGNIDKGKRDPAPVGMPNSQFEGIYDLPGNIFEMQDTYYGKKIDNELEQVYNCACGGLQRTKSDWPPRYMGQILGFIRNKDCGFRIVVDGDSANKNPFIPRPTISESKIEFDYYSDRGNAKTFIMSEDVCHSDMVMLLRYITLSGDGFNSSSPYIISNEQNCEINEDNIEVLKIFSSGKIKVMLICKDYHIFAYRLEEIAYDNVSRNTKKIKILFRENKLSPDSYLRKSLSNDQIGDLIDLVIEEQPNGIHYYTTKGIPISNCKFKYENLNYELSFSGSDEERSKIYELIKKRLGLEYYLPNWVDLADFIQKLATSMKSTETDEIDNEIVTSVLTTIDTSYLHQQLDSREKKNES